MPRLLLFLACLCLALPPATVRAQQVQRCIGPDGRAVYTDRRCDDIGAISRLPPAAAGEGPRLFRGGCPRQLSQLVGEIGAAIQNRDVNRLASVYDWSGATDASASRTLDRLEAMAERPLVDIVPVYASSDAMPLPEPPPPDNVARDEGAEVDARAASTGPEAWMPSWTSSEGSANPPDVEAAGIAGAATATVRAPLPPARPRPVGLRVEQTLAGRATPSHTVFGLRRSYGCFWLTL
ncbi:hypothetical protein [Pseudoxanthomonas daejeonensis]|uniref:DUF4124 domain-containing protein n=1 Tax=Pseudoxanthomonas daejeonensis TaxID=266062 RepID=A0ABQ6Z8D3_9GAMM|nr:hypothetical protein [Pseudoxanthomonas daejeonensis]KAF1695386.1 hypothetical protein CSC65_06345 [Pseudoxanthomonas daejeonensis]